MTTIIDFPKPEPTERPTFEITFYRRSDGMLRYQAIRLDNDRMDPEALLVDLMDAVHATGSQGNRFFMSIYIGDQATREIHSRVDGGFDRRQLAWLRRRLSDIYWGIAPPRGIRYLFRALSQRFSRHSYKETSE